MKDYNIVETQATRQGIMLDEVDNMDGMDIVDSPKKGMIQTLSTSSNVSTQVHCVHPKPCGSPCRPTKNNSTTPYSSLGVASFEELEAGLISGICLIVGLISITIGLFMI